MAEIQIQETSTKALTCFTKILILIRDLIEEIQIILATGKHRLCENAEVWLCCKILYIASIAVKIYIDSDYYAFHLSQEMFQDLFRRVLQFSDEYAKEVGLMFGKRLLDSIKSIA